MRKINIAKKPAAPSQVPSTPAKPANVVAKPAANTPAKPAAQTAPVPAKPVTEKPAKPFGSGYINRAATMPQLYGADHVSDRDNAYLRFFASFLRGKAVDAVVTYAAIIERSRACELRNPLPGAGGKNGCADRGILSRFEKFGYTVNVNDPSDNKRRIGFRFTPIALNLASVKLGMRDVYGDNGRPSKLAD